MTKLNLSMGTLLLSATLLVACGNQNINNGNNPAPTTSINTTEPNTSGPDSVTATNELSTQSSSNNVKWDEINDPLVNKAMKDKLKASVDAIVQKDVDAFHKTLSPDIGFEHDYLLDNPVKFTALGKAVEENRRILVPVKGENQRTDSNGAEMTYTFYFEKDKSGEWQIVSID